jgi:hypothetical protein
MDAQAVIDSYINSVALRLPRRLRNEIGTELRTLRMEELANAGRAAGRAPDEKLATELVRGFGRPEEVAARYSPRGFQIIEPEHASVFVALAVASVAIQWALTLPLVLAGHTTLGDWWRSWGFGAFSWVGMLVTWFGLAAWVRRRSPVDSVVSSPPWTHQLFWLPDSMAWRPFDGGASERRVELRSLPIGLAAAVFFIAPHWFIGLFTRSDTDISWALYNDDFRGSLLPAVILLMLVRLAVCAAANSSVQWRARLHWLRFCLWVIFVGLLAWAIFGWTMLTQSTSDTLFKAWLLVFLLVNVIQIALWLWRAFTRVRVPNTLP